MLGGGSPQTRRRGADPNRAAPRFAFGGRRVDPHRTCDPRTRRTNSPGVSRGRRPAKRRGTVSHGRATNDGIQGPSGRRLRVERNCLQPFVWGWHLRDVTGRGTTIIETEAARHTSIKALFRSQYQPMVRLAHALCGSTRLPRTSCRSASRTCYAGGPTSIPPTRTCTPPSSTRARCSIEAARGRSDGWNWSARAKQRCRSKARAARRARQPHAAAAHGTRAEVLRRSLRGRDCRRARLSALGAGEVALARGRLDYPRGGGAMNARPKPSNAASKAGSRSSLPRRRSRTTRGNASLTRRSHPGAVALGRSDHGCPPAAAIASRFVISADDENAHDVLVDQPEVAPKVRRSKSMPRSSPHIAPPSRSRIAYEDTCSDVDCLIHEPEHYAALAAKLLVD